MNREFKAGDIVVLSREGDYLGALGTILAEEKYLFEVESRRGSDRVDLKSISTNIKFAIYVEAIRHATLKEKFLRAGNVVKLKNGRSFVVIDGYITNYPLWHRSVNFNDDLTNKFDERANIMKVYSYVEAGDRVGILDKMSEVSEHSQHKLLWERKPETELTSDEILILKNIDKKYKYIARDNRDSSKALTVFEKEPQKNSSCKVYVPRIDEDWGYLYAFSHLFQNITFESGVHLIADLLRHATLKEQSKTKLTSDEVAILKNIDKKYKYIARDRDDEGSLAAYKREPEKDDIHEIYTPNGDSEYSSDWEYLSSFDHLFEDITFESGAHLIADLIRENENV